MPGRMRIPSTTPSLLWSAPRRGVWTLHADLFLEIDGLALVAADLVSGEERWRIALPFKGDEIIALSPATALVRMPGDSRDSVARVDLSGRLLGVLALESHKPGASWLSADGRGGWIEGCAHGYESKTVQMRSPDGAVVWEGTCDGILPGPNGRTLFRDGAAIECRVDGQRRWRMKVPTRWSMSKGLVTDGLLLIEDNEFWNEWAEDPDSSGAGPPVHLLALSMDDGHKLWSASISGPVFTSVVTPNVLYASGTQDWKENLLHRVELRDGSVLPDTWLPMVVPKEGVRLLDSDDVSLLYATERRRVCCVPAGAPEELVWSLDAEIETLFAKTLEGVIVCGDETATRAYGVRA